MMKLKVKKLNPMAQIPKLMSSGAAGMDLTATDLEIQDLSPNRDQQPAQYAKSLYKFIYSTGLAVEIPEGYVGLIFPRSSIHKTDMILTNCVGVIDSDYRGEIKFVFRLHENYTKHYEIGDRIGQLVIVKLPEVEVEEVSELSETIRGDKGFGSTGQ